MLWDIIRNFFVQYIFGGNDSLGNPYSGSIGRLILVQNGDMYTYDETLGTTETSIISIGNGTFGDFFDNSTGINSGTLYVSMGDWLSTTATIIVLIGICVALFFFIRWLFRLTSGLFLGR